MFLLTYQILRSKSRNGHSKSRNGHSESRNGHSKLRNGDFCTLFFLFLYECETFFEYLDAKKLHDCKIERRSQDDSYQQEQVDVRQPAGEIISCHHTACRTEQEGKCVETDIPEAQACDVSDGALPHQQPQYHKGCVSHNLSLIHI